MRGVISGEQEADPRTSLQVNLHPTAWSRIS